MSETAAEKETVKVIRFGEEIVPFAKIGSANLPEGLMSNTFIVKGLGRLRFIIERIHPGSKLDTTKVFQNPYSVTAKIELENNFSQDYLRSWQRRLGITVDRDGRTLYGIPEISQDNRTFDIVNWSTIPLKKIESLKVDEEIGTGYKPSGFIEEASEISGLRFMINDLATAAKSFGTYD